MSSLSTPVQDFSLNVLVTQSWYDPRLQFYELISADHLELDSKLISKFWVPDLYFVNEKSSEFHDITVPNRLLHLYRDGRVVYKMRISLTATCLMELHRFPMDQQTCSLFMKSFGFTNEILQFRWSLHNPLTCLNYLEMSQFILARMDYRECQQMSDYNDSFSCLQMDLKLHRRVGFYMIQLYIPSALVVVLSWVSFCLDVASVPGRVSLGILTVLTITNMKTMAVSSLPKVSYIKAIDVWMVTCLSFAFASLLEFAVVNSFARRLACVEGAWTVSKETEPLRAYCEPFCKSKCLQRSSFTSPPARGPDPRSINLARMIDKISMVVFPIGFIAFIFIYTLVYVWS
ncbi:Glycine receptor subunit alpha-3 [Bulinus truncatus]|nr:Glycine receptor subunit alpha-3 [Bulinus truncatus]